jgi:hypothetical protein
MSGCVWHWGAAGGAAQFGGMKCVGGQECDLTFDGDALVPSHCGLFFRGVFEAPCYRYLMLRSPATMRTILYFEY